MLSPICSPQQLEMDCMDDMSALLKIAHKYDMPGVIKSVKDYLMPYPICEVR